MNDIKNYIHGRDYKHVIYYTGDNNPFLLTAHTWSYDGTKLYGYVTSNRTKVTEFTLGVPWDITSVTSSVLCDNTYIGPNMSPVFMSDDGTKFFFADSVNKNIYKFELSTPFDLTTGTQAQVQNISTLGNYTIYFSPDGLKMFSDAKYYNLSAPWDLSTATLNTAFATFNIFGVNFSRDGLYVTSMTSSASTYGDFGRLTTAWDLSTYVKIVRFKLNSITGMSNNGCSSFSASGHKWFYSQNGGTGMFQFNLEENHRLDNPLFLRDKHNTIVGGMGANIYYNSTTKLATRLGIAWSRIKNFEIKGDDIYCTITGGAYQAPNLVFSGTEITSFIDKDGLCTTSAGNMFFNCASLVSIYMPTLTTTVYRFAAGCTSLTTVYAPLISAIVPEMFINCGALTTISLGTATTVGTSAFQNCTSLGSVTSTGSITTINSYAFNNTPSLTSVNFPSLTGTIGAQAFRQSGITTFNAYNATISGTQAFAECSNLTTFTGNSLTDISIYAFHQCVNLTTVSLPELLICGYWSFYNTKISDLELPKLVTAIANDVFSTMKYLNRLFIPSCTTLGSTSSGNNMFIMLKPDCQIYANVFLQTNNGGAPDGDLTYAIVSRGATVNYI